ncbi:MAG: alternative ribosome rescue aminoacyl-tRNA hydrolase ArfB [Gelidibacter sp.]
MDEEALIAELKFKAVRSSGAGGQNVNKVASKVELVFSLGDSLVLTEDQKALLVQNIGNRLTKDLVLLLQCDESRSQHKNKTLVIKRFLELINEALIVPEVRIPTKIPKAVIKKRLHSKRKTSEKKTNRKPPEID